MEKDRKALEAEIEAAIEREENLLEEEKKELNRDLTDEQINLDVETEPNLPETGGDTLAHGSV